ncbi:MAG: aminotransferase class I/II-fold pyridoxal phosphate-dependent enzyme [Bdellovibrionales bacterium]|nr:aminotransferase class I/II-fold pyridoxal phosphate-dependent enzyme [Bdellovibrionales bacterium]
MAHDRFPVDTLPPYSLGSIARSVQAARRAGRDIVDLSQVNPAMGVPPTALDRLVQAALRPHNHQYSSSQGIRLLRRAVERRYRDRFQVALDPDDEVIATMGIKEGIGHLLLATVTAGDSVIVATPSYPVHLAAVRIAGASSVGVPLFSDVATAREQDWELGPDSEFFGRLDGMMKHAWPKPKMMLLNFPHNPTGTTVRPGFFDRLVDFARANNVMLVHDFAYADIGQDGYRPPSLLQVPRARDVAIEFSSCSKGLSLAGWRVGFAAGNRRLVAALRKIKSYLDFGIFQPLQIAAAEALVSGGEFEDAVNDEYSRRRTAVVEHLNRLGWRCTQPRSGVFVWAEMPEPFAELGSINATEYILKHADLAASPGAGFDRDSDRFCRFSLGEPEGRIQQGMAALGALPENLVGPR